MTAAAPCPFPSLDPALIGVDPADLRGALVLIDLRQELPDDALDAIGRVLDAGDIALLHDPQGQWADCALSKADGVHLVVGGSGLARFADLKAALRHGLTSWPRPAAAKRQERQARRWLRRAFDRMKGTRP